MSRLCIGCAAILVLVLGTPGPSAQAPGLRPIMRDKLDNAQRLLEGIVTGDLAIIDRYGERLTKISYTEVASWQASGQPEYLRNASMFVDALQGLRQATAEKNADAAAREYGRLVSACLSCHTYLRNARTARIDERGEGQQHAGGRSR